MKRFLIVLVLMVLGLCFTGCSCNDKKKVTDTYDCTYWLVSRGTMGLNILKNDDGSDVYAYYQLLFYNDGTFRLVFLVNGAEKEEVYAGKFEDKTAEDGTKTRYLTYYNKPDEFQNLYGATPYVIDGNNLERHQHQISGSSDSYTDTIISQTFVKKK